MKILAKELGKKYGREWIFRGFDYEFEAGKKYAITGRNGSGKSTLLKILATTVPSSTGSLSFWNLQDEKIPQEHLFKHMTFMAPYMELIEEFSLKEFIRFYIKFKPLTLTNHEFIDELNFANAQNKQIRFFSSGMKQRLQLGLALFTKSDIVFLDEPTSNLDKPTTEWYRNTVTNTVKDRLLIVSSNQKIEYDFCDEIISMDRYKY